MWKILLLMTFLFQMALAVTTLHIFIPHGKYMYCVEADSLSLDSHALPVILNLLRDKFMFVWVFLRLAIH